MINIHMYLVDFINHYLYRISIYMYFGYLCLANTLMGGNNIHNTFKNSHWNIQSRKTFWVYLTHYYIEELLPLPQKKEGTNLWVSWFLYKTFIWRKCIFLKPKYIKLNENRNRIYALRWFKKTYYNGLSSWYT